MKQKVQIFEHRPNQEQETLPDYWVAMKDSDTLLDQA